jgi:hypothetical protein
MAACLWRTVLVLLVIHAAAAAVDLAAEQVVVVHGSDTPVVDVGILNDAAVVAVVTDN